MYNRVSILSGERKNENVVFWWKYNNEPLYAEAVLVENGIITAVGDEDDLRPLADEYVDMHGAFTVRKYTERAFSICKDGGYNCGVADV